MSKTKSSAKKIGSFQQLEDLITKPVVAQFFIDQELVEVPCRRMNQEIREREQAILRAPQPPFDRKLGERGEYNLMAKEYQEAVERAEKVARAVVVYWGCPIIASGKPGLVDDEAIYKYLREKLSETVLQVIYLTIKKGGLDLVERTNFSSAPGSAS